MTAAFIAAALYALHQDVWFWRQARPFVFGFLPIGLFYHVAYTLASSLFFWFLVRSHWPSHLQDPESTPALGSPTRGGLLGGQPSE
jgi:hypothetical protein